MRKLVPLFLAVALGAAMIASAGAPYDLAARQQEINHTPAAQVHKAAATYSALSASLDRPTLPPGMTIVLRDRGGGAVLN